MSDQLAMLEAVESVRVVLPSPEEILAKRTDAAKEAGTAAWTAAQLAEWGVPWPPPAGWRKRLESEWREREDREARVAAIRARVEAAWRDGHSVQLIWEALGWDPAHARRNIKAFRAMGWDLPPRSRRCPS